MKDKINHGEHINMRIERAKGITEERPVSVDEYCLNGFLSIEQYRNGRLIQSHCKKNNIIFKVLAYLHTRLTGAGTNHAIDDLFTDDAINPGGTQDNKDGIIVVDSSKPIASGSLSTITTIVSPSNTYGAKWRGEISFDGDYTIDEAYLGYNWNGTGVNVFEHAFASQTTFSAYNVQSSDRLILNWELYG